MKSIRKFFFRFRRKLLLLKHPNLRIGRDSKVDLNTVINIGSNILEIGKNVHLRSDPKGYHAGMPFYTSLLIDKPGGQITIGDNCRINGCYLHAKKSIIIKKNTVIASGTNILDSNGHKTYSNNRTLDRDDPASIQINENVWIGINSTILKGTIIGKNSIVTAGSVVKGIFPDNSLIQGNPGKVVKTLKI